MNERSDKNPITDIKYEEILGLGKRSIRKSYYPELKRRIEELEKIRAILDHSSFAIFIVDVPSGRIIYSNAYVAEKLRYDEKSLKRMTIYDFFGEGKREWITKFLEALPERCEPFVSEIKSADGEPIPCEIAFSTVSTESERFAILIVHDIRDRIRVEEALKATENLLVNIIEQSPESMMITDSSGTVIRLNRTCRKMFGINRDDQLVGRYNILADPQIEQQGFSEDIQKVFSEWKIARFTIEYELSRICDAQSNEINKRILTFVIFPVSDEKGNITNAVIAHIDETEKIAEENLKKRAYQQIEKNMEQFAVVLDEIRNPLSVIIGLLESSGNEEITSKVLSQAGRIEKILDRLEKEWVATEEMRKFIEKTL
ncbi:MAG: PAS domain S-box protein [Methanomassiliicoccales archaeon]|nr:PAS domain S-box protein [Methanomassiliicoccales archaeon]